MDKQAEAEHKKRAAILVSEGVRQAQLNIADGVKISKILEAQGVAEAILVESEATKKGIALVSKSFKKKGGEMAARLRVAQLYIDTFANIAKESKTLLLPINGSIPANVVLAEETSIKECLSGDDKRKSMVTESTAQSKSDLNEDTDATESTLQDREKN